MSRQSPADLVNKLVREAVNKSQDGPVPEVVLCRLLSVAEAVFRQELETDDQRLSGLRLGYALEDKTAENADTEVTEGAIPQKLYWIGWGHHSIYDELLEPEKPSSDDKADPLIDASSSALHEDVLEELLNQLEEEMIRSTPSTLLEGKVIRPFVFGHTIKSIRIPGAGGSPNASPVDGGDGGSGGGQEKFRFEGIFSGIGKCDCPGGKKGIMRGEICNEGVFCF